MFDITDAGFKYEVSYGCLGRVGMGVGLMRVKEILSQLRWHIQHSFDVEINILHRI